MTLPETINSFLNMKTNHPSMALSILALHLKPVIGSEIHKPYLWLAQQRCTPTISDESELADLLKESIKSPWAVHMYVDNETNLKAFKKAFLCAHDVLQYTVPIVHMTRAYWNNYKEEGLLLSQQQEVISRLTNNIVYA